MAWVGVVENLHGLCCGFLLKDTLFIMYNNNMKKLPVFLILFVISGCNNVKIQNSETPALAKCNHSAQELSKIPFGPTETTDYLIRLNDKEKTDAGYNHYMGMYAWSDNGNGGLDGWVSPDGMTEGDSGFERASPYKLKIMNRLKQQYEKLSKITYVYCDGTSNNGESDSRPARNPPRYNPEYPIALRAANFYQDEGLVFLYFEDENCNPIYKTPNGNRGNIILREVCRPLNPGETRPSWSVS